MKIGQWAKIILAAAPLLAGCGDFWQAPSGSSSSTTTTTSTTLSSGDFYILSNGSTPQIYGYYISSGTLTAISGSPWTLPDTPTAMAIDPTNSYLYIATNGGIYLYTISSGALTESSTPISSDTTAEALSVDSSGQWLLEATDSGVLNAIPLDTSTGAVVSEGTIYHATLSATTVQPSGMAISPANGLVAVALQSGGTDVIPFTAGTSQSSSPFGTVKTITTHTSNGGSAISVAFDPSTRFLYIGETDAFPSASTDTGALRVFTLSSGALGSELSTSPYTCGGTGPHAILPIATGDDVYVVNWSGTAGVGFEVVDSGSTPALTQLSATFSAGTDPVGLVEDSDSNFVIAVSSGGSPSLDAYIFDTTTASTLDTSITSSTVSSPVAVLATR